MKTQLRVLLTNICLNGRSGTEIVTRNIALALVRQGHCPIVFTLQDGGSITRELRQASVPVITDLRKLREPVDVVHGHHHPTTAIAAARFPEVPVIFVCHDFAAWYDVPPRLANIGRYIAVDFAIKDRLTQQEGIDPGLVRVILNAVDTERFRPGEPLAPHPSRALLFAKDRVSVSEVGSACEHAGIPLDIVGGAFGEISAAPEQLMPRYDIVFSSAMTALEALACGRAVVVCDGRGLAGMVTPANYEDWRQKNFGRRTLTRPLTAKSLIEEIEKYDPKGATGVMRRVRKEADVTQQVDAYLACYREAIDRQQNAEVDLKKSSSFISEYLQAWSPRPGGAWPWMEERARLLEQIRRHDGTRNALKANHKIWFSTEGDPSKYFHMHGFSDCESWGTWTDGDIANLGFRMAAPPEAGAVLELVVVPFIHDRHRQLRVTARLNGIPADVRIFDERRPELWQLKIPKLALGLELWVALEIELPASPRDLGLSEDMRHLGLGFVSVMVKPGGVT